MIADKTVFILGAGASKPYGFPIGIELYDEISKDLWNRISTAVNVDRQNGRVAFTYLKESEVTDFCNAIYRARENSIDKFLSLNPKYELLGKLAIILFINRYEVILKNKIEHKKTNRDWCEFLLNDMMKGAISPDSFHQILNRNFSFITFNYDRSFEYLFQESMIFRYNQYADKQLIIDTANKIPVHHVYGSLEELKWEFDESNINSNFGNLLSYSDAYEMTQNINVINDRGQENILQITQEIESAASIVFLGFGYAKENMELLNFQNLLNEKHNLMGTVYGMTEREISEAKKMNSNLSPKHPQPKSLLYNLTCLEFLRDIF